MYHLSVYPDRAFQPGPRPTLIVDPWLFTSHLFATTAAGSKPQSFCFSENAIDYDYFAPHCLAAAAPMDDTAAAQKWMAYFESNPIAFIRLPFWAVYYLVPFLRPDSRWTWRQALSVRLFRFHFTFSPTIWPLFTAPCEPGMLGGPAELFEAVDPAPQDKLCGILDPTHTDVRAASRPGNWYPTFYDPRNDMGKRVMLYFFGGGYVVGGHTHNWYQGSFDKLLRAIGPAKIFTVGYRLSSTKGNHFPAQLIDAVSVYQHMLTKGIAATDILLVGDSAGGNIVLALLRYLTDHPGLLPPPAAAFTASPWVDLSIVDRFNDHRNVKFDIVTERLLRWGVDTLVPGDVERTSPYLSPSLHPFTSRVPLWIEVNENEVFVDDIVTFANEMKKNPANDIEICVLHGGSHATLMIGSLMGFFAHVDRSTQSIQAFLESMSL